MQKDSCKCLLNNVAKMYNVQLKPQQYFEPNALIRKSYKITVGLSAFTPTTHLMKLRLHNLLS